MAFAASTSHAVVGSEIAGRTVVLQYTDPLMEYEALNKGAAVVERSHRHRLVMRGEAAAASLNGLVTNDVSQLQPGHGQYAAALSTKGKIIADLRIFRRTDGSFLIDTSPRAAQGWMGVIRKYVNPRLVRYSDDSDIIKSIGVFGPQAGKTLTRALGLDLSALAHRDKYSYLESQWRRGRTLSTGGAVDVGIDTTVGVAVMQDSGPAGYDLFVDSAHTVALTDALVAAGGSRVGLTAWEIARIEHGIPEWGIDFDENTLAQEGNLEKLGAISFTKGCYTGQETVARVHFRGHINRHLMHLQFPSATVPPSGAQIHGDGDRIIGDVRSSVVSPRFGGLAIAMIRREVPAGSDVTVKWEGTECPAHVHELPINGRGAVNG